MKKIRILRQILKTTRADKIVISFILFTFLSAFIILLVEPNINTYSNALWYCYAVISTVGFGDIVAITFIGKIISVLLTIYSLFVIAIATGVVVSFYTNAIANKYSESRAVILDKLEHLPDLSKEELAEISNIVKKIK